MAADHDRLIFIDWLRTIAISLVLARHLLDRIIVGQYGEPTMAEPILFTLYALAGFGWSGVHLFFLVSGYLVGGYVVRTVHDGTFRFGEFTMARALRILPAAYAVIVLVGLLFFDDGIRGIVKNFLFVQTYTSGGYMSHYWSLCVEIHFYAALPLIAYATRNMRISTATAVLAILAFATVRAVLPYFIGGYLMKPTMTHWLPDFFAVGILLAVRPVRFGPVTAHPITAASVYIVCAVGLAALSGHAINNVTKANWGVGLFFALVSSTAIFVAVKQAGLPAWPAPSMRVGALLSYAIYLVHLPIMERTDSIAIALLGTAVAAIALHVLIERPFLGLKDAIRTFGASRWRPG
jgi:peptidoglycan/LPS O-acetylase OafA/YrhL